MDKNMMTHYERYVGIFDGKRAEAAKILAQMGPVAGLQEILYRLRRAVAAYGKDSIGNRTDPGVLIDAFINTWVKTELDASQEDPPSMERFINRPGVGTLHSTLKALLGPRSNSHEEAMTSITTHVHVLCHEKYGRQVYDVTPGLAEQLCSTEVRGLSTDDLQLPYPSIYVTIPPHADLKVYNTESDWHKVVGCYVTEDRYDSDGRTWQLLVIGEDKAKDGKYADDALFHFAIPLPDGLTLDDALTVARERIKLDATRYDLSTIEQMSAEWYKIFRFVMNAMLYVSWPDAGVDPFVANKEYRQLHERIESMKARGFPKDNPKLRDCRATLRGLNPMHRIILGKNVTLAKVAEENERLARAGHSLMTRILVPGHWRMQAYGPGNSLRKKIRIQPYWRGPEGAPISESVTRVVT